MSAPQNNLITFTPGTVIQSAQVNQNFNDIVGLSGGAVGSQLQTLLSNNFNGFVQSGGIITTASGLTVNMAAAYVVVGGITYYMPAQAFTVTASKDTYIDFVPGTIPTYQAQNVANNAASPSLYATNAVRMAKIVSGASAITYIQQFGEDTNSNYIYPNFVLPQPQWIDFSSWSTIVGWSSFTTKYLQMLQVGKLVYINFSLQGTSNNGTSTFTVPTPAKTLTGGTSTLAFEAPSGLNFDNGAIQSTPARIYIDPTVSTSLINIVKAMGTASWTSSGNKDIRGVFFYEAA